MTVTAKALFEMTQATTVDATVYTASQSGGVRTIIDKLTATNISGGAVTATVNLVPFGNAVGSANVISSVVSIAANGSFTFPEIVGHILNPGDFISIKASANTALNFRSSGREITA